jgi:hypothetical protein
MPMATVLAMLLLVVECAKMVGHVHRHSQALRHHKYTPKQQLPFTQILIGGTTSNRGSQVNGLPYRLCFRGRLEASAVHELVSHLLQEVSKSFDDKPQQKTAVRMSVKIVDNRQFRDSRASQAFLVPVMKATSIIFFREQKVGMELQSMDKIFAQPAMASNQTHFRQQESPLNQSSQLSQSSQLKFQSKSHSSDGHSLRSEEEHVKIRFEIQQDENGYPPVSVEYLWAVPLERGQYRIDNVPFFVLGVSCDDIVNAQKDQSGMLQFVSLASEGGHSTVRLILFENTRDDAPLSERTKQLREKLRCLGCSTEQSHIPGLFSVDIPQSVSFLEVRTLLQQGASDDLWDYEEATIAHSPI